MLASRRLRFVAVQRFPPLFPPSSMQLPSPLQLIPLSPTIRSVHIDDAWGRLRRRRSDMHAVGGSIRPRLGLGPLGAMIATACRALMDGTTPALSVITSNESVDRLIPQRPVSLCI